MFLIPLYSFRHVLGEEKWKEEKKIGENPTESMCLCQKSQSNSPLRAFLCLSEIGDIWREEESEDSNMIFPWLPLIQLKDFEKILKQA